MLVEARPQFFDEVIRHLIAGNVRRGHTYPLCVGAERGVQAKILARTAQELGSDTVAHGCTAAGNDQFRFEMAMRALAPEITVLAPVRDESFQRREQIAYLAERGAPQLPQGGDYSINRGLWGVTIGGRETLTSAGSIPETAWVLSAGALEDPLPEEPHELEFEAGLPVAWDGQAMQPVELIETLEAAGGRFGIGRGIHLGDTILGSKGRVAYEAPAAEILLCAHRELEKLTLGAGQMRVKDTLAAVYGDLVHEGKQLDPVCRDIEAFSTVRRRGCRAACTWRCSREASGSAASNRPIRCWPQAGGCTGRRPGNGLHAMRSAPPGSWRCPACCTAAWAKWPKGVAAMRSIVVDKLASVASGLDLGRELRVGDSIPSEEGVMVAVEILNDKSSYNRLELASGRMARVRSGDIVVGALGHRKALFGYSGHLPETVKRGDVLQLLNIGGVIGVCDSVNATMGSPFDVRILGVVLEFPYLGQRVGVPARVGGQPWMVKVRGH